MEFKRKQTVLRQKFGFRFLVCILSLFGCCLYLKHNEQCPLLWGMILGLCGSALVWALVELIDWVIHTHYHYESERNSFYFLQENYFQKMKSCIKSDINNIPMYELSSIVSDLYDAMNKFLFSSEVYVISAEFEKCCNYIERMYWKFESCCSGMDIKKVPNDEYYIELHNALLQTEINTSENPRDFSEDLPDRRIIGNMTTLELSFESYCLPKKIVSYDVTGNIRDSYDLISGTRTTITFVPDIDFSKLHKANKTSSLEICLSLLFRTVRTSDDDD